MEEPLPLKGLRVELSTMEGRTTATGNPVSSETAATKSVAAPSGAAR